jgi:hypothetical protein
MSESEWKDRFKAKIKTYFRGADWDDAEREGVAQQCADASWPEYSDEEPEEVATAEAAEMAAEGQ